MLDWYHRGHYKLTATGAYSFTSSYIAMGDCTKWREVEMIWSSVMLPRQRLILWLPFQNKLLTKTRLQRLNILVEDTKCCLCDNAEETRRHLMGHCQWITVGTLYPTGLEYIS